MQKLKKENPTKKEKPSNKIKEKSLQDVVEKVLIQKNINRTKHVINKKKFKNIGRKMLLVKMFSRLTSRETLEAEQWDEDTSSLTYFSCSSSMSLDYNTPRSSLELCPTSPKRRANPDILIQRPEQCDVITSCEENNQTIIPDLLSASYGPRITHNIHGDNEGRRDSDEDLFSTNYKKDSEECSINISVYDQVRPREIEKDVNLKSLELKFK